jgi:DNA replication and repair protein RecF
MILRRLTIQNLRSLRSLSITPAPTLNLFVGSNGSGKTSLLEGIHILGLGRTFRTQHIKEVITRGEATLTVFGQVAVDDERNIVLGVERREHGGRIRIDGREIHSASLLAKTLPMFFISPHRQWLLAEGAQQRRRLIDWTMFHVERGYLQTLQQYQHALVQRNAALKEWEGDSALSTWDRQLAGIGETLNELRQRYISAFVTHFEGLIAQLMTAEIRVEYYRGWDCNVPLYDRLGAAVSRDRVRGYTSVGPHRADLRLRVGHAPAHRVLSRGEGKLLVLGFLLAQVRYVAEHSGRIPVVMIDDLPSELDGDSLNRFLDVLVATGAQSFITLLSERPLLMSPWQDTKWFHVKQGTVQEYGP